ncbi:hypothetical protein A3715_19350 [Oleiphilus sp. HI0009]|nr:hypothetical protein A3715_10665 [Oleiphilus sp. HI0009]KZX80622.1 hypothetical protein A3715_19350 [Oleiphilus sp. HI0009]
MGAKIRFVAPEHEEIIKEYLQDDGVILVMTNTTEKAVDAGVEDGDEIDYEFGGEANYLVDVVCYKDHSFFDECKVEKLE